MFHCFKIHTEGSHVTGSLVLGVQSGFFVFYFFFSTGFKLTDSKNCPFSIPTFSVFVYFSYVLRQFKFLELSGTLLQLCINSFPFTF